MSETARYRHLVVEYCSGSGVDVGSGGDPVVPWAIQVDLPWDKFREYNGGRDPDSPIQLTCDAGNLPFKDGTLDFVYSSHLLEDFWPWKPLLTEWKRVVKPRGYVVILIPDKELWAEALKRGQPPNCAHKHEGTVGELTRYFTDWKIIRDSRTNEFSGDYSILFIARKPL